MSYRVGKNIKARFLCFLFYINALSFSSMREIESHACTFLTLNILAIDRVFTVVQKKIFLCQFLSFEKI